MQEDNINTGPFSVQRKAGLFKKVLVMNRNTRMYPHDFQNNKAHLHLASCVSRGVQICLPVAAEMSSEWFRSTHPTKMDSHPVISTTLIPINRLCRAGSQPDLVVRLHGKWHLTLRHVFVTTHMLPGDSVYLVHKHGQLRWYVFN